MSSSPVHHLPVSKKDDDKKKKNEMTPEEKQMKERSDMADKAEEDRDNEIKKNIEVEGFLSRLRPYTKPVINSYIGIFVSII